LRRLVVDPVSGDKHLLDHPGLEPGAINAREACELLGLI
jgi:hypothetical protein